MDVRTVVDGLESAVVGVEEDGEFFEGVVLWGDGFGFVPVDGRVRRMWQDDCSWYLFAYHGISVCSSNGMPFSSMAIRLMRAKGEGVALTSLKTMVGGSGRDL